MKDMTCDEESTLLQDMYEKVLDLATVDTTEIVIIVRTDNGGTFVKSSCPHHVSMNLIHNIFENYKKGNSLSSTP